MNIIYSIILLFKRKKMIQKCKPSLVFWYITFNGDQDKIRLAMESNWGIENESNFNQVMDNVKIDDYLICIEKEFYNYQTCNNALVIKKPL